MVSVLKLKCLNVLDKNALLGVGGYGAARQSLMSIGPMKRSTSQIILIGHVSAALLTLPNIAQ